MSTLTDNVTKVKNAHAALKTAIEAKGVSVPAGTKLTGMPALVDQIQTGGGGEGGYLTFTAVDASTLTLKQYGSIAPHKLLKSTDAQNWTKWENPSTNGISLQAGESVYLKADEDASHRTSETGESPYNYFSSTGAIACTGDPAALIKLAAPADYQYCFADLFRDCTPLTKAPELPSATLSYRCYYSMFRGCTSLTEAPELPATKLTGGDGCYEGMFQGCTSLTAAPALPAATITNGCYKYMFKGCTSLTEAPELPATDLLENYSYSCYYSMFQGCTSLTEAPELPATNVLESCYSYMFDGCTSLTAAPVILPATDLGYACYARMFQSCGSLTEAPELPATKMVGECYSYMFQSCWSLKRIKMNASSGSWGSGMFLHCTALELVDMTGSTDVPTLGDVNTFDDTNGTYKVVVPDSLYDEWIAATNWVAIATHIMKQSDWNAAHPDDQL